MIEQVIIAGAGGQGIMLLGKVLATAAMRENKFVTWLPAYGAEVRGGAAHCTVIISDSEIGSPYTKQADTLIIMNAPSLKKFHARLKNKGLLILNSSLVTSAASKHSNALQFPFTEIAEVLGNSKVANMVALGVLLARKNITAAKKVLETIEEMAPADKKELIAINKEAFLKGVSLIHG
jgi:2-oxoglutarate ferredoxin oxidoreductase subunit gamma